MKILVCSWNINSGGSNVQKNMDNLIKELEKYLKNIDVLVIGLQEMNSVKLKININNFDVFDSYQACYVPNFKVVTYILVRKTVYLFEYYNKNKCYNKVGENTKLLGTKGMIYNTFSISKNREVKLITLINCHMPFKNEKATNSFIKNMKSDFYIKGNILLFGDLNSRSILTDEGYKKNITCNVCSTDLAEIFKDEKCQVYCYSRMKLHSLKFKDTYGAIKNNTIISILKKSDFLTMKKLLKEFKEKPINFYPTYKRDNKTGLFSLEKKDKARLPGYADRILYKGKFSPILYTTLGVIGSDHLPIIGIYKF